MAKPKNKRKKRNAFPPGASEPSKSVPQRTSTMMDGKRPMRWDLVILFVAITFGGTWLYITLRPQNDAPKYTYKVLNTIPHDPTAFTQGLLVDGDFIWESTGRKGESSIRKIDRKTGEILKKVDLDEQYFGEGLALHGDKLYQLTWKENKAFVYDRELNKIGEFDYAGQGWGLTSNGTDLIFTDGSTIIKFLDPETFEARSSIRVRRGGVRVGQLNELEYVGGKLFANSYMTDEIYEIDPATGDVTAVIDLEGLWPKKDRPKDGVLNGIAFNPDTRKLLVTGKLCPKIFEIDLVPVE